jgi:hypothetical protein
MYNAFENYHRRLKSNIPKRYCSLQVLVEKLTAEEFDYREKIKSHMKGLIIKKGTEKGIHKSKILSNELNKLLNIINKAKRKNIKTLFEDAEFRDIINEISNDYCELYLGVNSLSSNDTKEEDDNTNNEINSDKNEDDLALIDNLIEDDEYKKWFEDIKERKTSVVKKKFKEAFPDHIEESAIRKAK